MQKVSKEDLQAALKRISKTSDGKRFLFALMKESKFHNWSSNSDDLQFLNGKRSVYGYFRQFIECDSLIDIEHGYILTDRKNNDE